MTIETKNAKIASTMLGKEGHGIMTCMIDLDYGGVHQGFGGYEFSGENSFAMGFIKAVLKIAGVSRWEDLPGKYIRAKTEPGHIHSIGHITKDEWFAPEKLARDLGLRS